MSDQLLTVRGLSIHRGDGAALLDALDLDVAAEESVGIVGESGSGKSLTARAIMGLLPPGLAATGKVEFNGQPVLGASAEMESLRGPGMTMVLQDPFTSLSPLRRCERQITDGPRLRSLPRRERRQEAIRRLAEVGISEPRVAHNFPFQLSGGMRQRVALAAALASDPELLIADEFSTALDATTQKDILLLLDRIRAERGMALLMITHDLRMAFSICDRVYVIYAGSLLEVGEASDVERDPLHPYTQGLLLSEPALDAPRKQLYEMPGRVPPADDVLERCAFADRCGYAEAECRSGRPALRLLDRRWTACRRIEEIHDRLREHREWASTEGPRSAESPSGGSDRRVLTVEGMGKRFPDGRSGELVALASVDLHLEEGETLGIVGESGSGKTTLARCIVGLEQPSAGRIDFMGRSFSSWADLGASERKELRRLIQYVFQDPYSSLNPKLSVGSVLAEATRIAGVDDADREVERLLDFVQLPTDYASRKPAALSGGERQRIAIARALAVQPKVIICDEVASALDVSVQAQILNLLRNIQENLGVSYIFISHDLAVVRHIADRICVMLHGEVVEEGDTGTVIGGPQNPYTRTLLAASPGRTSRPDSHSAPGGESPVAQERGSIGGTQ